MADFITLTGHDGTRIRFCIANIATYQAGHHGGIVTTTAGVFNDFPHMTDVRETPEQIDAMLGVTDTVTALVEALQTVRIGCHTAEVNAEARYGKNWRNEVIDAAIAKWRGAGA